MITCEKIAYPTKHDAQSAVVGMQKSKRGRNQSKNQPVVVYRCNDCGLWHMASGRSGKKKKSKGLTHTHTTTIKTRKGKRNTDYRLRIQDFTGH